MRSPLFGRSKRISIPTRSNSLTFVPNFDSEALPKLVSISCRFLCFQSDRDNIKAKISEVRTAIDANDVRSEEHTSELQSLMRISYAVFCLKKKTQIQTI